jgi:menaquinone-dependent protoporphyrinogen oxidase
MSKKALVVYATRCGSTQRVAQIISDELAKNGYLADLTTPDKSKDVAPYNMVVVGTAIRAGKCMSEAQGFLKAKSNELASKKTSLFVVCLTMKEDNQKSRAEADAYFKPLESFVKPASKGMFGGAMDFSKVPFIMRPILKKMGTPEGDFVDEGKIREWARQLGK